MKDVLDRAADALREEDDAGDPGTLDRVLATLEQERGTLDRILHTLDEERGDQVIDRAAAAMRSETESADSVDTLARIRSTLAVKPKRTFQIPMWAAAAVALLAMGLIAPTAWAWTTGRLPVWLGIRVAPAIPAVAPAAHVEPRPHARNRHRAQAERIALRDEAPTIDSVPEPVEAPTVHVEPTPTVRPEPEQTVRPQPVRPQPAPTIRPEPVEGQPTVRPEPAPVQDTVHPEPAPGHVEQTVHREPVVEPAPTPSEAAETSSFQDAHRLHFRGSSPAAALSAWDRYLDAYPHGRYEPEARYNRALALIRLNRLTEARTALEPFTHGGYRSDEAQELVRALDARLAAPQ